MNAAATVAGASSEPSPTARIPESSCGLSLDSATAYRENVITSNTLGTVNGGVNAGGNVCNGSLTCP